MYYTKRFVYFLFILIGVVFFSPLLLDFTNKGESFSKDSGHELSTVLGSPKVRTDILFSENKKVYENFPAVSAEGVLISNINTGEHIYEKASHETFPIASLTKIMTALLFAENTELKDLYRVSEEAKKMPSKISSIPVNFLISGRDILKMMMIESDNDMAYLAGEKIGRLKNFQEKMELDADSALKSAVSLMNNRAYDLKMYNTFFANPIGFDDSLHYSTAHDLFVLMRYLWKNHHDIFDYSRHTEDIVTAYENTGSNPHQFALTNTNLLLGAYPQIIGSKTGLTTSALGTIVLVYQLRNGKELTIIILKSEDRFRDAEKILRWLDKGFL